MNGELPPLPRLRGAKWEALKALKKKVGKRDFERFIDKIYAQEEGYGPHQAAVKISRETGYRYNHARISEILDYDYPDRKEFPV